MDTMNTDTTNETVALGKIQTEGGVAYRTSERPTVTVALPHGWARALLAGLEATLFGWLVPVLAFVGSFLAVSSNPWLQDYVIGTAARMGTDFWASSLGAAFPVGEVRVTFVPLLWTILQIIVLRLLLLSLRGYDSGAVWLAVPGFTLSSVVIVALAGSAGSVLPSLLGSLLVACIGVSWAYARQSEDYPQWVKRAGWVWSGLRTGLLWLSAAFALGTVLAVATVVASWGQISEVRLALTGGGTAGFSLAALETMYLPDLSAWALAWLSGAGFRFVDAAVVSVSGGAQDFDSFLPMASAVPSSSPGAWAAALLGLLGVLLGLATSVHSAKRTLAGAARRLGVAFALFAASTYGWMWASTGSLGSGRLSVLGPTPLAWLAVSGLVGGVAMLVALVLHPDARAGVVALASGKPAEVSDGTQSGDPR